MIQRENESDIHLHKEARRPIDLETKDEIMRFATWIFALLIVSLTTVTASPWNAVLTDSDLETIQEKTNAVHHKIVPFENQLKESQNDARMTHDEDLAGTHQVVS